MKNFFITLAVFLLIIISAGYGAGLNNEESYESGYDDGYDHGYDYGYEEGFYEGKEDVYYDINQHNEELYTYSFTPSDAYDILYDYVENGTPISKDDAYSIMCLSEELPYPVQ